MIDKKIYNDKFINVVSSTKFPLLFNEKKILESNHASKTLTNRQKTKMDLYCLMLASLSRSYKSLVQSLLEEHTTIEWGVKSFERESIEDDEWKSL